MTAKGSSRMQQIRVALVGCGYIAQAEHLPNLRNNPDFRLAAVVEPRPEIAAAIPELVGVPAFATLEECLARVDLDAVVIATPRESHPGLIVQAAAAGKHILVEKPLATTASEAAPAVETARNAGIVLLLGYMRPYEADTEEALRLIGEDAIGTPVAAITRFQLCYRPVYASPLRWPATDGYRESDTAPRTLQWAMLEESIHHINLLRRLLGEPDQLLFAGGHPEAYQVVWRAQEALATHLNVSRLDQGERVEIYGTEGRISWRPWSPHFPYTFADLRIFSRDSAEERRPIFPRVNPYVALLRHFVACIRGDAAPRTPGEDGLRDLAFIEEILAAAANAAGRMEGQHSGAPWVSSELGPV